MSGLKCSLPRLTREYGRGWELHFCLDGESVEAAKAAVDKYRDGSLSIVLSRFRETRSLSANAYFHVLCGKIAKALQAGNDEVKRRLVLEYGEQRHAEDGSPMWFVVPKGSDPIERAPYPKWFAEVNVRGVLSDAYIEYKPTHTLTTAEMSQLIDGTISEAKALGIETLSPYILEQMKARHTAHEYREEEQDK